ncbi:interferon lambda receptor 1-like [Mobula hypostoma]|uniref:interferon lambda receptor 1-like n=1 Tax=Mobula hypostoma TaxID=723540 RepID=UPI002FC37C7C
MAALTSGAAGAGLGLGLIFCCLLTQHVLGGLPAPRNVSLTSKNFSLFLTWVPEEHRPENFYLVEIKSYDVWQPFTNCTSPLGEGCDVTCTIRDCYQYLQARVGSNVSGHSISWSFSRGFSPFMELELGAPQLKVVVKEESVLVHLRINLTACKEEVLKACLIDNLSYEVKFWNTDEGVRHPVQQSSTENIIKIEKSQLQGSNNCVSARSVYSNTKKMSNFCEPVCFELKVKGFQTAVLFTILASLFGSLLIILTLIAITMVKVKQNISVPPELKTPEALDFTRTIYFTQVEDYHSVECSLPNVIDCNESEEILEEKTAFERIVKQEETETSASNDVDCSSESDEEIECFDYTESRWIPDGIVFDNDELLNNDFHQTANTKPYQKADNSSMFSHVATDVQSQVCDCSNHDILQTEWPGAEDQPSSVTSEVLNSQNFHDSIDLLQHCDKHSSSDILLTSVQLLICDGEYDEDMLSLVHNHDMNFISSPTRLCTV